jgi:hypothetical protein
MWANRFGELTAIRFPIPTNAGGTSSTSSQTSSKNGAAVERVPPSLEAFREGLEEKILANLKPEELGCDFEPVREQALKAAEQSQDFGGLFLGFSFFLIAAALLLMAMLFQFGLEQRTAEIGTLLALGFTPKQVRRLLLGEGVALAFLGGVLGALGGMAYARAMLHGLTTIWREAVGQSALSFHATPQTLVIGLCASTAVSAVTIWLALRKFVRRPATQLLTGEVQSPESSVRSRGQVVGFAALASAFGLVGWAAGEGRYDECRGILWSGGAGVGCRPESRECLVGAFSWISPHPDPLAIRWGEGGSSPVARRIERGCHFVHIEQAGDARLRAAAQAESGHGGNAGVREFSDRFHRRVSAGCESRCERAQFGHGWLCTLGGNDDSGGARFELTGRTGFFCAE